MSNGAPPINCTILENLDYPVLYLDTQKRVVWTNPAARHWGQEWRDRLGIHQLEDCPVHQALTNGWVAIGRSKGPDGSTWSCKAIPTREQGSIEGVVVFAQDITQQIRHEDLEHRLRHQQKLESIGTLASGVAHEINNPINIILNYAQILYDDAPTGSSGQTFAHEIMEQSQRIAEIVHNLLAFARKTKEVHRPENMARIVDVTTSLIRKVLEKEQIKLDIEVEPTPDVRCQGQQIQQVLVNILNNARDALNRRYPSYDDNKVILIHVGTMEHNGVLWVRTTVEDHGMGIPAEHRARIFDPFFTTKPRDEGTGLGLAVSHGIVSEHSGEIIVESKMGEYTRLHLDLPAIPD